MFFGQLEVQAIAQEKPQRVNGEINAPEVRLVGAEGEQLGIVLVGLGLLRRTARHRPVVGPCRSSGDKHANKQREVREAARFNAYLSQILADFRRVLL